MQGEGLPGCQKGLCVPTRPAHLLAFCAHRHCAGHAAFRCEGDRAIACKPRGTGTRVEGARADLARDHLCKRALGRCELLTNTPVLSLTGRMSTLKGRHALIAMTSPGGSASRFTGASAAAGCCVVTGAVRCACAGSLLIAASAQRRRVAARPGLMDEFKRIMASTGLAVT